jgi:peptidyl-prolyl cis-trans isomerase SurA
VETALLQMQERMKERMTPKYTRKLFAAALLAAGATSGTMVRAQASAAQSRFQPLTNAPQYQVPVLPVPAAITPNGAVVEDVIVRVNDQIITRSELERSEQQLVEEAQQNNLSPADYAQRQRDLLRDMIDQQLLLSKGKELGINGDAETLRRLDDIRKQYHMDTIEELEKAANAQGVSFEDFKAGIRNNVITQTVVRQDVGSRLQPTHAQEQAYYEAHAKEFEQPESIHLSEILVPTPDNASDEVVNQAQAKAEDIAGKLKAGAKFADLAKQYSGDASAAHGGDLGDFKRGTLGKVLEDATFPLQAGGLTAPIRTRQGFVILRVDSHTAAGVPPISAVEDQVQQGIYVEALQPALRAYLTKARDEAYIDIKPGFVDSGSAHTLAKPDIAFTTYTAPKVKKKTEVKRRMEASKDAAAQQRLADERAKAAERAAAKAAKSGGVKNVSMPVKPKRVKPEKIRYGQAPRNALPAAPAEVAQGADTQLGGQAPGVAMAAPASATTITTGTGAGNDAGSADNAENADPLAPKEGPRTKTRYTARQANIALAKATEKAAKAQQHVAARPAKATAEQTAAEKTQAAPLGLKGDTVKKQPKPKRKKGDAKERLQEEKKPTDTSNPVAPTVNPALGGNAVPAAPAKPSSDSTTLPPVNQPAPGAPPQGQPLEPTKPVEPANTPSTTPSSTPQM